MMNGHGDVVQTVSERGVIENQYDYDIFGNSTLCIEGYSNAIRYAGEYLDVESGQYYLKARYYDSYTGRFTTADTYAGNPNDPGSLNLYTYCENDPINFIDPTGHTSMYINGQDVGGNPVITNDGTALADMDSILKGFNTLLLIQRYRWNYRVFIRFKEQYRYLRFHC
jgi:RHS repeat-associated protein